MRAALISIAGQPREPLDGAQLRIAGKSLARRQLDFALAAGSERIFVLGDGGSAEAIALRHAAERAGARVQVIRSGHELVSSLHAADELLVIAPRVLAEAGDALKLLETGNTVLVLPAPQGVAAGFERIDLARAWAGALVVPGGLIDRLSELPQDSEPASALLRIALQARVPEQALPERLLADGTWSVIGSNEAVRSQEGAWLKRNLPPVPWSQPARRMSQLALQAHALRILGHARLRSVVQALPVLLLAAGILAAVFGFAASGLTLVAMAAVLQPFAVELGRLGQAPFAVRQGWWQANQARLGAALVDAGLTACGVLAISEEWLHRFFPPLVLVGLLRALRPTNWSGAWAMAGDRMVLALALALACALGFPEPAIMLAALLLIALKLAQSGDSRG